VTTHATWLAWLIAFIGVDFAYYWWHRASHEVNVLWAAHIVHHQSEDYNLAVALRQAVLTSWTALLFYLPLALLGVPPLIFATTLAFSTLYQFWIHTQLIGKVTGVLDYVLNLPEHHRVHHAVNPRFLDKNYGATLIVWDRWFGTYQREDEPPVYGITKPLASFNPLWAQLHYWVELAKLSRRAVGLDKLRVFWKPPSWQPGGAAPVHGEVVSPDTFRKYDTPLSTARSLYLIAQYTLLLAAATALVFYAATLPAWFVAAGAACVVFGVTSVGALIEHKRWGVPLEVARLLASGLLVALYLLPR
jgi:alkylglycerol monooxygenase